MSFRIVIIRFCNDGGLTTYRGNDGNIYQVADTATININGTLSFNASKPTPQLRTQWTTRPEYVQGVRCNT